VGRPGFEPGTHGPAPAGFVGVEPTCTGLRLRFQPPAPPEKTSFVFVSEHAAVEHAAT
jgi:hypothetical protein